MLTKFNTKVQTGDIILCILCQNRVVHKVELIFLPDKDEVSEQF